MAGESLEGFNTTVLPVTTAAVVIPARIASGKFHGGITTPTPSGMYSHLFFSPGLLTTDIPSSYLSISLA